MAVLFKHAEHIFGDLETISRNNRHSRIVYNITKIPSGSARKAILLVFAEIVADSEYLRAHSFPVFTMSILLVLARVAVVLKIRLPILP